jgi:hypothetical protein
MQITSQRSFPRQNGRLGPPLTPVLAPLAPRKPRDREPQALGEVLSHSPSTPSEKINAQPGLSYGLHGLRTMPRDRDTIWKSSTRVRIVH